jgi:hypothetical protein
MLIPAVLAGCVAIGATVAIERLGGRLGGLLATLPSTIVPASLGIWAAKPAALAGAMDAVGPGMLLNAIFLWLWRVVPPRINERRLARRLTTITVITLAAWLVGALAIVGLGEVVPDSLWLGAGGLICLLIVGVLGSLGRRPAPAGRRRVGPGTLLTRGVFAALAIAVAIAVAQLGHPIAAGVASVFPAIFLTTMISIWISQGEAVQAGAVGPMMLGSASVVGYALLARFCLPAMGWTGAVVAWVGAVAALTVPAWLWLRRREATI